MMVASAGGRLPAGPPMDFARNQLGQLNYAFEAFVDPPVSGVDGRTTSLPDAAVDDVRRVDDGVVMDSRLPVADACGTARRFTSTDGTRPPDTAVLNPRVAQPGEPIAKPRKTTVRTAGRRIAGEPASRPTLDAMRREEAELDLSSEEGAINRDALSLFCSSSVAEARPERDLAINEGGGDSASTGRRRRPAT